MCACFSRSEQIVSGSDDRTVKVWDLRNMRAPLTNIQADSAVNKLSISEGSMVAVPQVAWGPWKTGQVPNHVWDDDGHGHWTAFMT